MIASLRKFGRLGNRLFTFSNLISFSDKHKTPIVMPAFDDYRRLFSYFKERRACTYGTPASESVMNPLIMKAAGKVGLLPTVLFWEQRDVFFDSEDAADPRLKKMIDSRLVLFEGWNFRSRKAIWESRDNIRRVFAPVPEIAEPIAQRIADMRKRGDMLIGIHVRWGDYRGTERFHELADYFQRMEELRAVYAPAKVVFLVFSDEALSSAQLPENSWFCSGSLPVQDMYTLAECDCIAGPPSTFSMWASFYGGHPLFLMKSAKRFTDVGLGRIATP
jgi:hypothetical protein